MAERGLPFTRDQIDDAYVCVEAMGSDGDSLVVTCEACGQSVREIIDSQSGSRVVLHRVGTRWVEWQDAPSFSDLFSGRRAHLRRELAPRGAGRFRERSVGGRFR